MKLSTQYKPVSVLIASLLLFILPACIDYTTLPLPNRKPQGVYHTVKKNQTLWRICQTYKVGMQEVAELNNIKKTSHIKAGDKIFIPGAKKIVYVPPTVKSTGPSKSKKTKKAIVHKTGMFIWPVNGKVIKNFGVYKGVKHDGINIKSSSGVSVKASYAGKVVFSSYLEGYGNTIIIQHKNKYATVYANNARNLVQKGRWIKRGQKIATVGTSAGASNVPHLHFQIRRWNQPRNPLFYLPKRG